MHNFKTNGTPYIYALVFHEVNNKKDNITSADLFWLRKNREGGLKLKTTLHYSYSIQNTSNQLSHLKSTTLGFVKSN